MLLFVECQASSSLTLTVCCSRCVQGPLLQRAEARLEEAKVAERRVAMQLDHANKARVAVTVLATLSASALAAVAVAVRAGLAPSLLSMLYCRLVCMVQGVDRLSQRMEELERVIDTRVKLLEQLKSSESASRVERMRQWREVRLGVSQSNS